MIQTFFMLSWILMPAEDMAREQTISYLFCLLNTNVFVCEASLTESSIIVALLV